MQYQRFTDYSMLEYGDRQADYARVLGYTDSNKVLHITDLWVDETLRNKGIARKLINEFAKREGATSIRAENILETAKDFWKHLEIDG
jgi:ribosomal protein S18 acetylase RimI-like enzyme